MRACSQATGRIRRLAMTPDPASGRKSGLPQALGAYLIWGFLPLYLIWVRSVPAVEFVGWRIIWTLPICLVIVAARRQFPALKEAFSSRQSMAMQIGRASGRERGGQYV